MKPVMEGHVHALFYHGLEFTATTRQGFRVSVAPKKGPGRTAGPIGLAHLNPPNLQFAPPQEIGNRTKRVQCEKVADLRIDGCLAGGSYRLPQPRAVVLFCHGNGMQTQLNLSRPPTSSQDGLPPAG